MQTNLDTANPAGQFIALPAPRTVAQPRSSLTPARALLRARAEAVRITTLENPVWLALALSAAALVLMSLWFG